ncbi:glycosyltransferase [Limnospira fusiformis KN01]|uniref:glycosyltransferase n=1 Tax=Limnospira TaxID=2596745 RepID=UPI001658A6B7|nr:MULTISPECIES: glycosyltransferase [Limnospira]MDT9188117.1 glycosyltransferase [Limnospira sp. PMC 894.15]MDT9196874.1 glycosyltransferase [Limnospira sp. PMC 1042.18]MDT9273297.1 glycosyltransferase [Limnospira sp. PMC 737.11]ULB44636.1 glycosyltransferase [Limnospira fusiformis KN01]
MAVVQPDVALFLRYIGGGGAERVMLNLGRGLIAEGLKVDLVLGKGWGPHLEKVPPEIRIVDLGASGVWGTIFALRNYLQESQPKSLLSALHYANEIAVWAKRLGGVSTRVVVSEHNTFSEAIQHTTKLRKILLPLFVRYFYPWADGIVAVSQGAAENLAKSTGLNSDRIQYIYNPVITPELWQKAGETLDHPWFQPGEPPVILGVGKLEAQKDFPTLIKAFAKVRQVRQVRLGILGWGPDGDRLKNLIQDHGLGDDAALLGYADNPYPYMANAAVFVLSSRWEGLPTVLIEAMAVGTPVISTNCKSGAAEILAEGRYGSLVPVGDATAMAEAILATIEGNTPTVNTSWLEQFSQKMATQEYLKILGLDQHLINHQ